MADWYLGLDNKRLAEAQSIADGISMEAANDSDESPQNHGNSFNFVHNIKPHIIGFECDLRRGIARVWLPVSIARKITRTGNGRRAANKMCNYYAAEFGCIHKVIVYSESNTKIASFLADPDSGDWLLEGPQIEQQAATAHPFDSTKGKAYPRDLGPSDAPILAEL